MVHNNSKTNVWSERKAGTVNYSVRLRPRTVAAAGWRFLCVLTGQLPLLRWLIRCWHVSGQTSLNPMKCLNFNIHVIA